ncbi:MAG: protein kinase [Myxococcota bacterium]
MSTRPRHPGLGVDTQHDLAEQNMRNRLATSLFGESHMPVKVDRYVVLQELGAGGLGVVYAAYDPKLDRRVALKLINPARLTPAAAQRMQREAQAMAQLAHPHVATIHDTGTHGDGTFIAMELVDGVTLSRWTRQQDRTWKEIRDVLSGAGQGLAAAHRENLIHRDFKPANVLVDAHGRARVLDFGLACAADEVPSVGLDGSTSVLGDAITETGILMGTPRYMSPEQFAGRADARSDQWAFCVAAWELLYRTPPFTAPDVPNLRQVVNSGHIPPTPPDSPVPGWLERVLRRGLSVDPAARFADMDALLTAMDRDKRSRRRQRLGVAAAVVLSAALTGTLMLLYRPEPTGESRARVEQYDQQARAAAAEGRFVYPAPDAPQEPTAFARVVALEQIEGPSRAEAQTRAAALREELAQTLVDLGDEYTDRSGGASFAADYYAAALIFAPDHPRARGRSTLTPGELSALRHKAETAEFSGAELAGAQVLAALAEPNEPERAAKIAALYDGSNAPAASTSMHLEELLGSPPRRAAKTRRRKAPTPRADPAPPPAAADETPPEAAAPTPPPAPTPLGRDQGPRNPAAAAAETKRGRAALARGDDAAAETSFFRALSFDRRNVGAQLGLSELYFDRGSYQKSLSYARKAVKAAPRNGAAHMQHGDACFKVHRYDEARAAYVEAQRLSQAGATRALERLDAKLKSSSG